MGDFWARAEARSIMHNVNNPKHELYKQGDKKTVQWVSELLRRAYPETLEVTENGVARKEGT
jgi:hypothetical protein